MRGEHVVGVPGGSDLLAWLRELGAPGTRLQVDGELGRGGIGVVEVVIDPALGRRMARKTLLEAGISAELMLRMFVREARIVAQLDHPHIAPIHDLGLTPEGMPSFTMKLVGGRTLDEILASEPPGPLSPSALLDALEVLRKVCDALAFAHSRGVLHCDLKPENLLVGDYGEVYLMDWGVARLLDANDEADDEPVIMGTPAYMAPEQAHGWRDLLDVRTDVFGVGAILYQVLARKPPYRQERLIDTVLRAQQGLFELPGEVWGPGAVAGELERIVLRAMARDPDDRYWSVRELTDDLVRFLRGGGDLPRLTFVEGASIIREGDVGHEAYIIVTGRCQVRKRTDGGERTLREMGRGELFGETALLTAEPRSASVVALEDTVVAVVTDEILAREMDSMKPWMAAFVRSLAARFREADAARHAATADEEVER